MESLVAQEKEIDRIEEAKEIGAVYKLLSKAFIREVDAIFLTQIKTSYFYESLRDAGLNLGDEFFSQREEELIEALAVEYARLFIVPGDSFAPYESVYIEERFYGHTSQQIEGFYQKCGMEVVDKTLMPDHIGLEMELMSYLKQKQANALENNDDENASRLIGIQKEFMTEHLGKWAPQFFGWVEEEAEHTFYKEMAKLGKQLILVEQAAC